MSGVFFQMIPLDGDTAVIRMWQ